jgi:hypothetical protein
VIKWNKDYKTIDIGTMFWIEFNTCRTTYRCGISYTGDNYSNYVELSLFYPTLTLGYLRKRLRDSYKELEAIEKELNNG